MYIAILIVLLFGGTGIIYFTFQMLCEYFKNKIEKVKKDIDR